MKIAKSFTDGMALFLAVLIVIYLLTGYIKFAPDEEDVEDGSAEAFLDSGAYRQYFNIALIMAFSAAAGIILRRKPEIAILTSALALGYVLTILDSNLLIKYPMVVVLLALGHAAGTFVYAASEDRRTGRYSCLNGGLLCAACGFALTSYTAVLQKNVLSATTYIETLAEEGLTVPVRLQSINGVVDMIYVRYLTGGISSARTLSNIFTNRLSMDGVMLSFHNSIDGEQYVMYIRLSLLLLAAGVLALVLRRHRLPAMLITLLPVVYAFIQLQRDCLSTMSLVLLTLCCFCALGGIVSFDQHGREPIAELEHREYVRAIAGNSQASSAALSVAENGDAESTDADEEEDDEEIYYT